MELYIFPNGQKITVHLSGANVRLEVYNNAQLMEALMNIHQEYEIICTNSVLHHVVLTGSLELLMWLHDRHNLDYTPMCIINSVEQGHTAITEYLLQVERLVFPGETSDEYYVHEWVNENRDTAVGRYLINLGWDGSLSV
jgi:hypothetical protein